MTDVDLVYELDEKLQLINLAKTICHKGHVPYEDIYYSVINNELYSDMQDFLILCYLGRQPTILKDIAKGIENFGKGLITGLSDFNTSSSNKSIDPSHDFFGLDCNGHRSRFSHEQCQKKFQSCVDECRNLDRDW